MNNVCLQIGVAARGEGSRGFVTYYGNLFIKMIRIQRKIARL